MIKNIIIFVLTIFIGGSIYLYSEDVINKSKTQKIATFLEEKINTGGFYGCHVRVLDVGLIQCDLNFPLGTNSAAIKENVSGIAELFGQIGLASTIFFTGYSGNLKICEYKYDPFTQSITKKK